MPFKMGAAGKRSRNLNEELDRLIPEIIKLGVEKVVLFGSLASNNVHKSSDIDIIIVQKNVEKKFLDRLDRFYEYLKPEIATDIFVYSPEEFEQMKNNSFLKSALKNGKVIYEKQNG